MLFPSFHHQNISLSTPCKHLFIRESSWRPQNISLQSFWHITRFQHDQKMRHFWLISAAHRPLIDQDDLIVLVMHCDAVWCTVMQCDALWCSLKAAACQCNFVMCITQCAMCTIYNVQFYNLWCSLKAASYRCNVWCKMFNVQCVMCIFYCGAGKVLLPV